jgi:glycosyltransferase involved in cell wall biosynthesis
LIAIEEPYFLSVCVPVKVDRDGIRWCDALWAKDLSLHLEYLNDLTLACPRIFAEPSTFDRPLNVPPFNRLKFIDLPSPKSHLEALAKLPELIIKMWNGIRPTTIVHSGFGGWPISEAWLAVPFGKIQKKFVITVVESSFWRVTHAHAKWHHRIRGRISERLNRLCVKAADLRFFTSEAYREEFLGSLDAARHAYVTPATWIDEAIILTEDQAAINWSQKSGDIRLLFAGRLLPEKGLRVLLDAVEQIENDVSVHITIIGEGPLAEECAKFVSRKKGLSVKVEMFKPVQYGSPFFELLRGFDAVIVPSLSAEQPRLIFDAFSQGISVLGSRTGGIAQVVDDGVNGKMFRPGDSVAIAETMRWASRNRNTLRLMGLSALRKSHQFTHRSMHDKRSQIISAERKATTSYHDF